MKTIAIAGMSGFVGSYLKDKFTSFGHKVIGIKRSLLQDQQELKQIMEEVDIIINLAGANIINRWSDSYKKLLYSSRIQTTQALVKAMENTQQKPELFISTSAVGIYKNDKSYDESCEDLADDFLGSMAQDWEAEALKAQDLGIRTAIFRFGIVMGKGGALQKMLLPFKMGVGGTIGDGSQAFSFIHIDDLFNAYMYIIQKGEIDGIFNLTAPNPTTNKGLTKALGKTLNRPTIFPVPEFILQCIFSEGAKVLTDGQHVIPTRLMQSGFKFQFETIEATIEDLV